MTPAAPLFADGLCQGAPGALDARREADGAQAGRQIERLRREQKQGTDNEQIRRRADRKHAAGGEACQRAECARHARDEGGNSGREGDPPGLAHVAAPLCGRVPHSAAYAEKLGARKAASGCRLPCSQFFSVGSGMRYAAAKRCCDMRKPRRIAFTSGISTFVTRMPRTFRPLACLAACCMLSISSSPNLLIVRSLLLFSSQPFNLAASLRTIRFSSGVKSSRRALA